jgi:hypothetical protein
VRWSEADGRAVARDGDRTTWSGTVDGGARVSTVLPVVDSGDAVLLLHCDHRPVGVEDWHPFFNLIRVAPDGTIRWRAELVPQETVWKCYLQVEWRDGRLGALAASYECTIDPATGRLIEAVFTK